MTPPEREAALARCEKKEENQMLNKHALQPLDVSDPTVRTGSGETGQSQTLADGSGSASGAKTARYILHDPVSGRYHVPPITESQATATALNLNKLNPARPAIERIDIYTGQVYHLWRAFGQDFDEKNCWKKGSVWTNE